MNEHTLLNNVMGKLVEIKGVFVVITLLHKHCDIAKVKWVPYVPDSIQQTQQSSDPTSRGWKIWTKEEEMRWTLIVNDETKSYINI